MARRTDCHHRHGAVTAYAFVFVFVYWGSVRATLFPFLLVWCADWDSVLVQLQKFAPVTLEVAEPAAVAEAFVVLGSL